MYCRAHGFPLRRLPTPCAQYSLDGFYRFPRVRYSLDGSYRFPRMRYSLGVQPWVFLKTKLK